MAKDKPSKPRRPRAETPRGFRDYLGAEVRAREAMLARVAEVYHAWGFEPLESPAVEMVEALGKFLPDVDRPNEGVFAWEDPDEGWLALRYDLTAPLARVYAQHRASLPNPYRRYAMGPVWRNEKPGPGRFRQFYQCDADTVGSASVAADAEICAMLGDALEALGLAPGDYVIRVNNRKVLNGVLEVVGHDPTARLGAPGSTREQSIDAALQLVQITSLEQNAAEILRTIDKFDKIGKQGVRELLTEGRQDASGAFIKGVGLQSYQVEPVLAFLTARGKSNSETLENLRGAVGTSNVGLDGIQELEAMAEFLSASGTSAVIDPSVVRGLGYYTGPVFEAELTFEIRDDKGRPRQFGSVAGGGRYDDLVKRFTGETVPATGISIGVDRLLAALEAKGRLGASDAGPVVVTVMDRDRMADYQAMAAELRAAGIRAEAFLGGGGMGRQLKYADQRRAPVAVIEGADERARGVVQLKDLALGARLAADIETRAAWAAQPAQVEVPRARLVAEVRAMLARGG
jgi:histidyl-tRNA synthetase